MTFLSEPVAVTADAVTATEVRHFMRGWATGVTVVTSALAGEPTGCTVNAFTSVSLDPPLLLVSLSRESHTLATIRAGGIFAVNLLAWRQRHLATRFTGAHDDRFAGVDHRLEHSVPVIKDVAAAVVCGLADLVSVADHVLVLGHPLWCESADCADPVLFLDGRYQRTEHAAD
jgi:flavin reductase (DIM6/NTAB) family NADH-FMN oxidoreductase RutF